MVGFPTHGKKSKLASMDGTSEETVKKHDAFVPKMRFPHLPALSVMKLLQATLISTGMQLLPKELQGSRNHAPGWAHETASSWRGLSSLVSQIVFNYSAHVFYLIYYFCGPNARLKNKTAIGGLARLWPHIGATWLQFLDIWKYLISVKKKQDQKSTCRCTI